MTVTTFDTLKYANTLKAAGVPEMQAEAQATVLADALAVNLKDLATKDDLAALKSDLEHEIALVRAEFRSEFILVRAEFNGHFKVLHWMVGATIALLLGQLGLLVRLLFVRMP